MKIQGKARAAGAKIAFDPNYRPRGWHDPKKAKELLAAAGQTNIQLTLQAPNGRWAMDKDIAQAVAKIAHAFGMKVLATRRTWALPPPEGISPASLADVLAKSDAVSLHWATSPR